MSTKYLKMFNTHAEYEAYINGPDKLLPNVSHCKNNNDVHYNPYHQPIVVKLNVTDIIYNTRIIGSIQAISQFSEIEIDGVVQPTVVETYKFDTKGEHTIKYKLKDPTSIGVFAFDGCNAITSVIIPNSVTNIASKSFRTCINLTSIKIPNSVTFIDEDSFRSCRSLTSITIEATKTPTLGLDVFTDTNNCPIYVPSNSVEAYKTATNWSVYADRIQAIPTT